MSNELILSIIPIIPIKTTTETEIKLQLSALPREIIALSTSVKIYQTYFRPDIQAIRTTIEGILIDHLDNDQIVNIIASASEVRTRFSSEGDGDNHITNHKLTIKTDGTLSRGETEVPITELQYNIFRKMEEETWSDPCVELGSISKTRHTFKGTIQLKCLIQEIDTTVGSSANTYSNTYSSTCPGTYPFILEIDDYHDNLTGLVTAEVEFDPLVFIYPDVVSAVSKFISDVTANVVITDVTLNKAFKNKNLAINQSTV